MRFLWLWALCLPASGQIVPAPKQVLVESGMHITRAKILVQAPEFAPQAEAFAVGLGFLGVGSVEAGESTPNPSIVFSKVDRVKPGGYLLTNDGETLTLSASTTAGAAHGAASLLQLAQIDGDQVQWPLVSVRDEADFAYRSFMVDMGRNPHRPETLRLVVDMMWYYKVNYLHLHLTDDQLISWPSKAFPKLQDKRARWTWEDFEQLEAYSQARGVTIIPEIEVPAHSVILRREYPEVFGETPTDLATSAEAQKGVETLIEEVLSVFQATPYVHIGADEAYSVPQENQRDLINRLNAFVRSKGKQTVVWEGPSMGEGRNKVSEDVIHINWRSIEFPAQDMLDAGYSVVCAPWDPMYIVDHYPRTMFTAVDVKRCYEWNPAALCAYQPRAPHVCQAP